MRFLIPLFFALLFSCLAKQEKTKPTLENITESVYASGIVKSRNQYQVYSSVNGLIRKIMVTEGDLVTKDQPIISLVNETSRITTENAQLAADYSSVAANADKLNELRNNIQLAYAKMQNDSSLLQRQRNLWQQQIGTRNQLDQQELSYKNSVNSYWSAKLRFNDMQKQLNFSAKQSKKAVQLSSSTLNDFTIRSKISGKVYSILKESGEMVMAQTPIAIIGDAKDFLLELQIDEYDIGKVRLGQKILVSMDSYKGEVFEAVVEKIDPIMNDRSRSFKVEASFLTKPDQLYPNLTVEANIIIQVKQNALTIPQNYLIDDSVVMLENKEKRRVVTGVKDYKKAEILSGLKKDEVIIKPVQ